MQLREHEPHISTLSSTGIPAPLGSYFRKPAQVTKQLVCDDGFNVTNTTNQQLMMSPKVHVHKTKPVYTVLNKSNVFDEVENFAARTV